MKIQSPRTFWEVNIFKVLVLNPYSELMNRSPWIMALILILLIPSVDASENDVRFNFTCPFAQLEEISHSLEIYGLGEYYPDLVEYGRGHVSLKVQVIGNWTELQRNIDVQSFAKCADNEYTPLLDAPSATVFKLPNGSLATEFEWGGDFPIIVGTKICFAGAKIYGINYTWQQESKCMPKYNVSCNCFISNLSSILAKSEDKRVLTISEYYSKKSTEQQWTTALIAIIGTLVGGFLSLLGSYIIQRNQFKNEERDILFYNYYAPLQVYLKKIEPIVKKDHTIVGIEDTYLSSPFALKADRTFVKQLTELSEYIGEYQDCFDDGKKIKDVTECRKKILSLITTLLKDIESITKR